MVTVDLRPAIAMIEKGYGLKAVATALGLSRSTLRRRLEESRTTKR
jgi:DNA invertase Pin-like site-specific DNA recombinase